MADKEVLIKITVDNAAATKRHRKTNLTRDQQKLNEQSH